jgi:hypothetical protein
MKKISTLAIEGIQIFKQNQLTIGLDLGEDKTNLTPTGLLMELENYYRVARRPRGRPALSELGVKVSLHPAQALRTPPEGRRGFETRRR